MEGTLPTNVIYSGVFTYIHKTLEKQITRWCHASSDSLKFRLDMWFLNH